MIHLTYLEAIWCGAGIATLAAFVGYVIAETRAYYRILEVGDRAEARALDAAAEYSLQVQAARLDERTKAVADVRALGEKLKGTIDPRGVKILDQVAAMLEAPR